MQFARDKRSGEEIPASKATSGKSYACPKCGEDVYVKAGFWRVRHFAHRSGRADPDCELYHPGSAIGNPLSPRDGAQGGSTVEERVRVNPLALGLRVEGPSGVARGDKRRWRLVLTLPKALTSFGRMRVPTGFGSVREVRLFSLSQAPQDIDVSPNAARFGPEWISDEVDHDYREAVSDRLEGLAQDRAYAFGASGGKVKQLSPILEWGDSYFIIWKRTDLALPKALNAQQLAAHEGWFASLIMLPLGPIEEIADWLQQSCKLRIVEARRQWGILFPPPIEVDVDGNILVSDASHVTLGFVETKDSDDRTSTLSISTATARCQVSTHAGISHIFEIARAGVDARGPLRFQWDSKQLPSIAAAPNSGTLRPLPAVKVSVQNPKGTQGTWYLLQSPDARGAFDRVRDGQAALMHITVPGGVTGLLEQRYQNSLWHETMVLNAPTDESSSGGFWSLSATQLSTIMRALNDAGSDVRLSFGVFGQYSAVAEVRRVRLGASLSADTRRRIIWYCRANGFTRTTSKRNIDLSTNTELLEVFRQSLPRPHLVAHRNLLQKRLQFAGNASDFS